MADFSKKMVAKLQNTKTRTFVIAFGALLVGGIVFALTQLGGEDDLGPTGSRTAGVPSSIKAVPGNVVPEKYRELQQTENIQRADAAEERDGSAVPTIIGALSQSEIDKSLQGAGQGGR